MAFEMRRYPLPLLFARGYHFQISHVSQQCEEIWHGMVNGFSDVEGFGGYQAIEEYGKITFKHKQHIKVKVHKALWSPHNFGISRHI
jgi:hypothetical protein